MVKVRWRKELYPQKKKKNSAQIFFYVFDKKGENEIWLQKLWDIMSIYHAMRYTVIIVLRLSNQQQQIINIHSFIHYKIQIETRQVSGEYVQLLLLHEEPGDM